MPETKTVWAKPELTALVRHRPEETVLASCKSVYGGGPQSEDFACTYQLLGSMCQFCSANGDS